MHHRPVPSWMRGIAAGLRGIAVLFWPGPCALCGQDLPARSRAGVCPSCWTALPARAGPGCRRCDLPAPVSLRARECPDCAAVPPCPELRGTIAAFVYTAGVRTLHRRLKFGGAVDLLPTLAARMVRAWRARSDAEVDVVVPVPPDPLRWTSRRRVPRLLARAVAERLGRRCDRRALRKRRTTRSLTGRRADARRRALSGVFRARPSRVAGRRVLVVDDVATTGATLREAARALAAAGAIEVRALVLARTPWPGGADTSGVGPAGTAGTRE